VQKNLLQQQFLITLTITSMPQYYSLVWANNLVT